MRQRLARSRTSWIVGGEDEVEPLLGGDEGDEKRFVGRGDAEAMERRSEGLCAHFVRKKLYFIIVKSINYNSQP